MNDNLLREWEACLNNGDLDGIVNLYNTNAVLWGTFSVIIRENHKLIREYFEGLFSKQDLRVKFEAPIIRSLVDIEVYSGRYEFSYQDNGEVKCPARYSFVFSKDSDGNYKILDHHSSIVPST